MAAIMTVMVLGPALVFFLFVLVQFWREAMRTGRTTRQHATATPFCMACAQGWPHELNLVDEYSMMDSRRQVLKMELPAGQALTEQPSRQNERQPVTRGAVRGAI